MTSLQGVNLLRNVGSFYFCGLEEELIVDCGERNRERNARRLWVGCDLRFIRRGSKFCRRKAQFV
jgi:hypothetical protein